MSQVRAGARRQGSGGAAAPASRLVCRGCGWQAGTESPAALRCPQAQPGDGVDHVIVRVLDPEAAAFPSDPDSNPFVGFRALFHAYHAARALGCSDEAYVDLVRSRDAGLAAAGEHGFRVTPFAPSRDLGARLGFSAPGGVLVKDETGNVSGSHKARHLMGTLLELEVASWVQAGECGAGVVSDDLPLAIASCGNAALAAAVVARAAGRRLQVFIPVDADPAVVGRLEALGAELEICHREPGVPGDPTYHRLLAALEAGAVPFTCQGNLNGLAIEGGETLGLEIVSQLVRDGDRLDRLFVQVGGGALASACIAAFEDARALCVAVDLPRIHAVQTRGAYPLARAYRLLADRLLGRPERRVDEASLLAAPDEGELAALQVMLGTPAGQDALAAAARHRDRYMWPWEVEPHSVAHGILDDETYDWLAVVEGMLASGGYPVVVDEATLEAANDLAVETTGIPVDHTGSSGLAGLIELRRRDAVATDERVAVLFTGVRRGDTDRPPLAGRPAERAGRG